MKLKELLVKDVINEYDGLKLGRVNDLEIDIASGKILNIRIKDGKILQNLIRNTQTIEIPWQKIIKIGSDVIIVDTNNNLINSKAD
ncbi:MAG: YlmC/YmxH family sporulation protein [Bacilli bacterium]|nr:YlmC/YmxH family sporulation protein [Bacilli bacterium]